MSKPLPMRDGILPDAIFLQPGKWTHLLDFLIERFPDVGEARWRERMQAGEVVDGDARVFTEDSAYPAGSRIFYYRSLPSELLVPFEEQVIYEDEEILVVDKPHFLPMAPSGPYLKETLIARLRRKRNDPLLEPLHRLDRETAGLVLVSRNPATRAAYHALFREHRLQKTYEALAGVREGMQWPVTLRSRIVEDEIFYRRKEVPGNPNAISHIDLVEVVDGVGRYRLSPVTGKTHQLRIHMASLGLPILNDPYYPQESERKGEDFSRPLKLLARSLEFVDPVTGEARHFSSRQSLSLDLLKMPDQ